MSSGKFGRTLITRRAALAGLAAGSAWLSTSAVARAAEEWDGVVSAAKKEGHVVLYSAFVGLAAHKDLKKEFETEPGLDALKTVALKLEGLVRQAGMHAAAVIIAPKAIVNFAPLFKQPGSDQVMIQYDKTYSEDIGLLKMDFLGLRNLSVIQDCLAQVKASTGLEIDPLKLPEDDAPTWGDAQALVAGHAHAGGDLVGGGGDRGAPGAQVGGQVEGGAGVVVARGVGAQDLGVHGAILDHGRARRVRECPHTCPRRARRRSATCCGAPPSATATSSRWSAVPPG